MTCNCDNGMVPVNCEYGSLHLSRVTCPVCMGISTKKDTTKPVEPAVLSNRCVKCRGTGKVPINASSHWLGGYGYGYAHRSLMVCHSCSGTGMKV